MNTIRCPHCHKEIDNDSFCPYCGYNIAKHTKQCPNCKNILPCDTTECPRCGYKFAPTKFLNLERGLMGVGIATLIIGALTAIIIFIGCASNRYIGVGTGFLYMIIILLISFIAGSQLIGLSTVINLLRDIRQKQ